MQIEYAGWHVIFHKGEINAKFQYFLKIFFRRFEIYYIFFGKLTPCTFPALQMDLKARLNSLENQINALQVRISTHQPAFNSETSDGLNNLKQILMSNQQFPVSSPVSHSSV